MLDTLDGTTDMKSMVLAENTRLEGSRAGTK